MDDELAAHRSAVEIACDMILASLVNVNAAFAGERMSDNTLVGGMAAALTAEEVFDVSAVLVGLSSCLLVMLSAETSRAPEDFLLQLRRQMAG